MVLLRVEFEQLKVIAKCILDCDLLLGRLALAIQVIPPVPTHFFVAWFVCRFSYSCNLLKLFHGFWYCISGRVVHLLLCYLMTV